MEFALITSDHFHPTPWTGGTTTELFIFPLTANYTQRNFQFRLSSATVETDKSDFTSLIGISRKLMVLDGNILIDHEDHYSRQLNKFDVDEFEGAWKTSSIGKCTDFNLMTTGKTSGELTAITINKGQHINHKIKSKCDWFFIYMYSGEVNIELDNKITTINKGDLLVLSNPNIRSIIIKSNDKSELVFSEIELKAQRCKGTKA